MEALNYIKQYNQIPNEIIEIENKYQIDFDLTDSYGLNFTSYYFKYILTFYPEEFIKVVKKTIFNKQYCDKCYDKVFKNFDSNLKKYTFDTIKCSLCNKNKTNYTFNITFFYFVDDILNNKQIEIIKIYRNNIYDTDKCRDYFINTMNICKYDFTPMEFITLFYNAKSVLDFNNEKDIKLMMDCYKCSLSYLKTFNDIINIIAEYLDKIIRLPFNFIDAVILTHRIKFIEYINSQKETELLDYICKHIKYYDNDIITYLLVNFISLDIVRLPKNYDLKKFLESDDVYNINSINTIIRLMKHYFSQNEIRNLINKHLKTII